MVVRNKRWSTVRPSMADTKTRCSGKTCEPIELSINVWEQKHTSGPETVLVENNHFLNVVCVSQIWPNSSRRIWPNLSCRFWTLFTGFKSGASALKCVFPGAVYVNSHTGIVSMSHTEDLCSLNTKNELGMKSLTALRHKLFHYGNGSSPP